MSTISTWTFTIEDLTATANQVKDLLSTKLSLPELDNFVIVVQRPSALGRFKKWVGLSKEDDKADSVCYAVLKKVGGPDGKV